MPKPAKICFLGDLPESVPSVPNILVVYGSSKKSSSIEPPQDALVILMKESINKWLHGFSDFAVIRGFMYAMESGVSFADKVIKENIEYIDEYREQLFYYSVVRHDRIILRYLIDHNMLPQKVLSSTLDILLYNDYREAIEKGTQIVSDYLEIHKQDTESLKLEWAYKLDSKKKNAMIVQFKGAAIDCVYIPAMINDSMLFWKNTSIKRLLVSVPMKLMGTPASFSALAMARFIFLTPSTALSARFVQTTIRKKNPRRRKKIVTRFFCQSLAAISCGTHSALASARTKPT